MSFATTDMVEDRLKEKDLSDTYNKFKEALLKATTKEHREEIQSSFEEIGNTTENIGDVVIQAPRPTGIIHSYEKDITLEDVVIAIKNKKIYEDKDFRLGVYDDGVDFEFWDYGPFERLLEHKNLKLWQLGKPAHEQSNETLEAIYNLLN